MSEPLFARRSMLAVVPVAALAVALLTSGPGVNAAGSVMGAGRTLLVSPDLGGESEQGNAAAAAISDDGRTVAYQREASIFGYGRTFVQVADVLSGRRVVVGNPKQDSTAPSLSGDGALVAFQTLRTDEEGEHQYTGQLGNIDLWTTNLAAPGRPTRRVTGTASDLRYQRVVGCSPRTGSGVEESFDEATRCGPQLSGDGTALAFPARLSLAVPQLSLQVPDLSGHGYDWSDHSVGMLDFGGTAERRLIEVTVAGTDAVRFTSVAVTLGEESFRVSTPPEGVEECSGTTVRPGETCGIEVEMVRGLLCGPAVGRLVVESPTPRGRTAVNLVGDDDGDCPVIGIAGPGAGASAALAAADCPGAEPVSDLPLAQGDNGQATQVRNLTEIAVGGERVVAHEVHNDSDFDRVVRFASSTCAMLLAPPDPDLEPDPDLPPACQDGMTLDGEQRCVAYVRYTPSRVAPDVATVTLGDPFPSAPDRVFRFTGAGAEQVVVVRRDPQAVGRFTGPDRPRARVASIDPAGAAVDGSTPSLSADGRYVAFVSTREGRLERPQVFVHDSDRRGDRSYRAGPTVLASRVGGPAAVPDAAYQPSLSGDGTRVAFVAWDRGFFAGPAAGPAPGHEVWVRDLAQGRSVLASTPDDDAARGAGASWSPSLSRDGSTVAFTSEDPDLLPEGSDVCCASVYVRDLGPDLGGPGDPGVRILSLRVDQDVAAEPAGLPAIDGIGAVAAFQSGDALVPADVGGLESVYARSRHADLTVSPASIAFPTVQLGTEGPVATVEVHNPGPGSARLTSALTGPYQLSGSCPPALHRAESCTLEVAFVPTSTGRHPGGLTVISGGLDWSDLDVVGLDGEAVPQAFAVRPATLSFPETGVGQRSEPRSLRLTNVLDSPISVTAVAPAVTPAEVPDFEVTPDASCADLAPAATCTVGVVFVPADLGERAGTVDVTAVVDGLPVTQLVPLAGLTATPEVTFSPAVAHEGRVTFVRGTNFAPHRLVLMQWSRGPVGLPIAVPGDDGTFEVPVVVIKGAGAGPRGLTLVMPGVSEPVEAPPLLVVQGSLQPPDFRNRN